MQLTVTIGFEQFKAANEAMQRVAPTPSSPNRWREWVAFALLVIASLLLKNISAPAELIFLATLIGIYALYRFPALSARQAKSMEGILRNAYNVQYANMNGQSMDISEDGISGRWADARHHYKSSWSAFRDLVDLPDAFIFVVNELFFVRVPKELLSLQDQETIKTWATENQVLCKAS